MIQKHCHECGTAIIERELEGETRKNIRPDSIAQKFLNAYLDE